MTNYIVTNFSSYNKGNFKSTDGFDPFEAAIKQFKTIDVFDSLEAATKQFNSIKERMTSSSLLGKLLKNKSTEDDVGSISGEDYFLLYLRRGSRKIAEYVLIEEREI